MVRLSVHFVRNTFAVCVNTNSWRSMQPVLWHVHIDIDLQYQDFDVETEDF